MKRPMILWLILFGLPVLLPGQSFELGIQGGLAGYKGELSPNTIPEYIRRLQPAGGLFFRMPLSGRLGLRADFKYLRIHGDDAFRNISRERSFRSDLQELTLVLEMDLFHLALGGNFRVAPYLNAGAGVFHFNPMTLHRGAWIDLQPLGTEGQGAPDLPGPYALTRFVLPGGLGLKLLLGDHWTLQFEGNIRLPFFDHLDDTGSTLITYRQVLEQNGILAARLSEPTFDPDSGNLDRPFQRGSDNNDFWVTGTVGLAYRFGNPYSGRSGRTRVKCFDF